MGYEERLAILAKYGFQLMGGNLLVPISGTGDIAGLQADPAFRADTAFASQLRLPTAQDMKNLADPHGPGNGEGGSDFQNLATGVGFITGGSSLASFLGAPGLTAGQSLWQTLSGAAPAASAASTAAPASSGGSWLDRLREYLSPSATSGGQVAPWAQPTAQWAGGIPDVPIENDPSYGWPGEQVAANRYDPSVWDTIDTEGGAATMANQGTNYADWLKTLGPAAAAAAAAGAAGSAGAGTAAAAAAAAAARGAGNGGIDDGALSQILNNGNSGPDAGILKTIAEALGVSPDGLLKALGSGAAGILGAIGSNNQADALKAIAEAQRAAEQARYEDLKQRDTERFQTLTQREDAAIARQRGDIEFNRGVTAPSRERYEGSFKPGFTMSDDSGFTDALNSAGKASMYGMSVNGNPFGSPNAWVQSQKDVYDKVAYPALKDYRTMNATTGGYGPAGGAASTVPGIGTNLSGSTGVGSTTGSQAGFSTLSDAAGVSGSAFGSLAGGVGNIFSPPKTLAEQLTALKSAMG